MKKVLGFFAAGLVALVLSSPVALAEEKGNSFWLILLLQKGLKILGNNQTSDDILPATHEPEILKDAELKPSLGEKLPLDVLLTDHNAKNVKLGDYFKGEMPTIITMGYYKCPMLCDLV